MNKILFWFPYILVLRPLIKRNYRLRELGELPDKWYWADELSVKFGFFNCLPLGFVRIPHIKGKIRLITIRIKIKLRVWGLI